MKGWPFRPGDVVVVQTLLVRGPVFIYATAHAKKRPWSKRMSQPCWAVQQEDMGRISSVRSMEGEIVARVSEP